VDKLLSWKQESNRSFLGSEKHGGIMLLRRPEFIDYNAMVSGSIFCGRT